jgi:MFS family permease
MAGGLVATADVNRIEAPVTWKAYLLCAFASFGGIFFGYDSGYINGVLNSRLFIAEVQGRPWMEGDALTASDTSLITAILSAGTFVGAIMAGDIADMIGRKWTIISGCAIYMIGKFSRWTHAMIPNMN